MKTRKVLDSFAVLAFLKQERNHERVKGLFSAKDIEILMNDVNIGETFYILARERGIEKAEYFVDVILPTLPITAVGNDLEQVIEAAKLKARYPISYADAFVVATAIREEAAIVTGDPDFKLVEGLVKIDWL